MSEKGTSSFVIQRATAVLLIPLAIWLLINIVAHIGADYASARAWLEARFNALLLGAFLIIGAWHMRIGMMEIIADYIYSSLKGALLFINWLVALVVIAAVAWSIYHISFAG